MRPASLAVAAALLLPLTGATRAADRAETLPADPAFEPLDRVIQELATRLGAQASTVAVSREGKLLHARGFGFSDQNRKKPTEPDALMRIASVTKPITAAAVRKAIRDGKLASSDRAFARLELKPPGGKLGDPRIETITINQLLNHRGGWDRNAAFDPMFRVKQVETDLKLTQPATPANVVEWMMGQPLQFAPGEKRAYSNFGYCVLGRVLEKEYGRSYFECVEELVLSPHNIRDIKLGHGASDRRDPREVWYPVDDNVFSLDVMDAHGALISSAPALCRFLDAFWISGEPRQERERQDWTHFGSLPGTTAMARQRPNGDNIAVLMNGRRNKSIDKDCDDLKAAVEDAMKRIGDAAAGAGSK